MKTLKILIVLISPFLFLACANSVAHVDGTGKMSRGQIQIKRAQIRENPSFLSQRVGELIYSQNVWIVREMDPWVFVLIKKHDSFWYYHEKHGVLKKRAQKDLSGWVHTSSMTLKPLHDVPLGTRLEDDMELRGCSWGCD